MNDLFCYLLVFVTIIFAIEYIIPLTRDTQEQVKEDFEMLKQMLKHGNKQIKFSIIIAVLVYFLIIHLLTISVLSGIEQLAKIVYS